MNCTLRSALFLITFSIRQHLNCKTQNVIYLINCNICKKSNVGCATRAMKERWSGHKSHIKTYRHTCEIVNHVLDNNVEHPLNRSTNKLFDESLSQGIEIYLIEHVKVDRADDPETRLNKCMVREGFWQKQLRTMEIHGGLNKRDSQRESNK